MHVGLVLMVLCFINFIGRSALNFLVNDGMLCYLRKFYLYLYKNIILFLLT